MQREPLIIRGAIVAAVLAIFHVLVALSVIVLPEAGETAVSAAVDVVATAVLVIWTRGKVTPVDAPNLGHLAADSIPGEIVPEIPDDDGEHRAG